MNMPLLPRMSPAEIDRLRALLGSATAYLEFGAGGSTAMAVEAGVFCTSVEADQSWIDKLAETPPIAEAIDNGSLRFHYADIGHVTRWSMPHPRTPTAAWANYYLDVWGTIEMAPDLVLIDGRFRAACAASAMLAAPEALVLIHDYGLNIADRQGYERVAEVADLVELTHSLAAFRRRRDVTAAKLLGLLNRVRDDLW